MPRRQFIKTCQKCGQIFTSENSVVRFCSKQCASSRSIEKRFWNKVAKTDGCWNWLGCHGSRGYGFVTAGKGHMLAHRFSFELHFGEIPHGMFVCHRCDNPKCVNPWHLFLGTCQDNIDDMVRKGRQAKLKGEDHSRTKLTEDDVKAMRRLWREDKIPTRKIAAMYGVGPSTAYSAIKGIQWKHVV